MHQPPASSPSRRSALAVLGGLGLGGALTVALTGCGVRWEPGTVVPTATPGPDDDARVAAYRASLHLRETATTSATAVPAPPEAIAGLLLTAARIAGEHAAALGSDDVGLIVPGSGDPGDVVLPALVDDTASIVATVPGVSGPLARLLASVATARVLLADDLAALTDQEALADPEVETDAEPLRAVTAVQAALAGEHAAVFGYGLVAGRLTAAGDDAGTTTALADLAAHRTARDDLVDLVTARGADPVRAAAGYDVQAATVDDARALAVGLEQRLAEAYATVTAGHPADRDLGWRGLLRTSRRARSWGGELLTLPGITGSAPAAAPAPSPSTP